ncbi:hypothetical protein GCM10010912_55520 [Paenibacillus albidus]|uniref:Uncharacterized protein n=1 Tax=Paenibacillus albidus TaxID=2041023 RepID=A0A917D166_9BACL|nr:hypothetical protein [Paenibacillus albidus]GGG03684.1 hypothetical protein GCM10010912_55520 [Paenibacillus albidus]
MTKNSEGDLVAMDIEVFSRREIMLRLREKLLAVEADRLARRAVLRRTKNKLMEAIQTLSYMWERILFPQS